MRYMARNRALGLCRTCPRPAVGGTIYCQRHREARSRRLRVRRILTKQNAWWWANRERLEGA